MRKYLALTFIVVLAAVSSTPGAPSVTRAHRGATHNLFAAPLRVLLAPGGKIRASGGERLNTSTTDYKLESVVDGDSIIQNSNSLGVPSYALLRDGHMVAVLAGSEVVVHLATTDPQHPTSYTDYVAMTGTYAKVFVARPGASYLSVKPIIKNVHSTTGAAGTLFYATLEDPTPGTNTDVTTVKQFEGDVRITPLSGPAANQEQPVPNVMASTIAVPANSAPVPTTPTCTRVIHNLTQQYGSIIAAYRRENERLKARIRQLEGSRLNGQHPRR